jgi:hypothetical protein
VNKQFDNSLTIQEKLTLYSLSEAKISHNDLPIEIKNYWKKSYT